MAEYDKQVYHRTPHAEQLIKSGDIKFISKEPGSDIGFHVASEPRSLDFLTDRQDESNLLLKLKKDINPARIMDVNSFQNPSYWKQIRMSEREDPEEFKRLEKYLLSEEAKDEGHSPPIIFEYKKDRIMISPNLVRDGLERDGKLDITYLKDLIKLVDEYDKKLNTKVNIRDKARVKSELSTQNKREWFEALKKINKKHGYDSFSYKNMREEQGGDSLLLTYPDQVKLGRESGTKPPSPDEPSAGLANALKIISKAARLANPVTTGLQALFEPKTVADATLEDNPELLKHLREKAFSELAYNQRGAPEIAMLGVQDKMSGGVVPYIAEHIGDLTHRMSEKFDFLKGSRGTVSEKVDKTLRILESQYGFEKEHAENLRANYKFRVEKGRINIPFDIFKEEVDDALAKYANEHKQLRVYNRPQWLAREASVAIGEQNFDRARKLLRSLKKIVDDEGVYAHAISTYKPGVSKKHGGSVIMKNPYDYQPRAI